MLNISQILPILDGPAAQALGFALFHFLWQGALIGVLLWAALRLLNGASPQLRYSVSCFALAALLAVPAVTGVGIWHHLASDVAEASEVAADVRSAPAGRQPTLAEPDVPSTAGWLRFNVSSLVWPYLPYFVVVWSTGAILLLLRLLGGWGYARYLATREARPVSGEWANRLHVLARRMGISRSIRLRVTERPTGPCVIGWLPPTILVPADVLSALPAEQVEALLAHELAHVQRHDYLANGLQSVAETLVFYHPAAWWTSRQIRAEREHCCDDGGAALCESPTSYAQALVALEASRRTSVPFALAAAEGPMLSRVRRLVSPPPVRRGSTANAALVLALLFSASALVAACADVITDGPPSEAVAKTSVQTADGVRYREWRPYDFSAGSDMKISLDGNYGGVGLVDSTWSKPSKRVMVRLEGFAGTKAEAEAAVREVKLYRKDGGLEIEGPEGDSARHWTAHLTFYKPALSSSEQTQTPNLKSYRDQRTIYLPEDARLTINGGSVVMDREQKYRLDAGQRNTIFIEAFAETEAQARWLAQDVQITRQGKTVRIKGPKNTDVRRWSVRLASYAL